MRRLVVSAFLYNHQNLSLFIPVEYSWICEHYRFGFLAAKLISPMQVLKQVRAQLKKSRILGVT